jgi:hypothetical protein
MFVRESIQEMNVPDHLRYFVDNVSNLVDAIYPSNILDFVRSDDTINGRIKNEFSEPFELFELVLFALSVMPIPILNLIPDFMLIVNNLMNKKRIIFTILSSIALIIKICTLLFFDFGPIVKMYYLSKKIKNFNMDDLAQIMDKTVNDILTLPGGISKFASGIVSKAMLPLASAGQLRPENMSIQLGNNAPISGANPMGALQQFGNIAGSNANLSSLRDALDNLKANKGIKDSLKQTNNINKLKIEIALLRGKINHRENVLLKYKNDGEYKKTWKAIEPNRENRIRSQVGELGTKLNKKEKELESKNTDQKSSKNTLVDAEIAKLESGRKDFNRKLKENICKSKESNNTPPVFEKENPDCSGVAKRVAQKSDKLADNRLEKEYYINKNKITEIDFQLTELKKLQNKQSTSSPEDAKNNASNSAAPTDNKSAAPAPAPEPAPAPAPAATDNKSAAAAPAPAPAATDNKSAAPAPAPEPAPAPAPTPAPN